MWISLENNKVFLASSSIESVVTAFSYKMEVLLYYHSSFAFAVPVYLQGLFGKDGELRRSLTLGRKVTRLKTVHTCQSTCLLVSGLLLKQQHNYPQVSYRTSFRHDWIQNPSSLFIFQTTSKPYTKDSMEQEQQTSSHTTTKHNNHIYKITKGLLYSSKTNKSTGHLNWIPQRQRYWMPAKQSYPHRKETKWQLSLRHVHAFAAQIPLIADAHANRGRLCSSRSKSKCSKFQQRGTAQAYFACPYKSWWVNILLLS